MIICLRGQDNSCYGCFAVKIDRPDAEKYFFHVYFIYSSSDLKFWSEMNRYVRLRLHFKKIIHRHWICTSIWFKYTLGSGSTGCEKNWISFVFKRVQQILSRSVPDVSKKIWFFFSSVNAAIVSGNMELVWRFEIWDLAWKIPTSSSILLMVGNYKNDSTEFRWMIFFFLLGKEIVLSFPF